MAVILITPSYGTPFTTWLTFMDSTVPFSAMVTGSSGALRNSILYGVYLVELPVPVTSILCKTKNQKKVRWYFHPTHSQALPCTSHGRAPRWDLGQQHAAGELRNSGTG